MTGVASTMDQQAKFQSALLQAAVDGQTPVLQGLLAEKSAPQFAVYHEAYRARLRSALRDNYATLHHVMGDESFDSLAGAYITQHPSTHYSLRWFGHLLPGFMADPPEQVDHPALTDLARLEWALRTAFDAADEPVLQRQDLGTVSPAQWPSMRLKLQTSVQVLHLDWAVGPVWHAIVQATHDDLPAPQALDHTVMVWRKGLSGQWSSITPEQRAFIAGLQEGARFDQLGESILSLVGEQAAAQVCADCVGWLIDQGALTDFQIDPDLSAPNTLSET
jgi:hypothetical protein